MKRHNYNIPVQLRVGQGHYKKAFTRNIESINGKVYVRYPSGKFSSWDVDKVKFVPNFNEI